MSGLLDRYIEYCWNLDKATLANTNFITWLTKEQGVLDLNTAKTTALRLATVALNAAVSMIAGIALNTIITKFNEWRTAIETNAQKSKELSSSITDLISQYKELGDKSGWDTDDFAQAKDLNAEILNLLKNQSTEMDEKLRKLDLENGKYQEQIDLLNELSISTLTQNKADQGKLLEQTAKESLAVSMLSAIPLIPIWQMLLAASLVVLLIVTLVCSILVDLTRMMQTLFLLTMIS